MVFPIMLNFVSQQNWSYAFFVRSFGYAFFIYWSNNMTEYTLLGEKIMYCRKRLNLSKKEFAQAIGVSPSTVSKYESGTFTPSATNLFAISVVTDMMMEDYIDETISLEAFKAEAEKTLFDLMLEIHNDVKELIESKKIG